MALLCSSQKARCSWLSFIFIYIDFLSPWGSSDSSTAAMLRNISDVPLLQHQPPIKFPPTCYKTKPYALNQSRPTCTTSLASCSGVAADLIGWRLCRSMKCWKFPHFCQKLRCQNSAYRHFQHVRESEACQPCELLPLLQTWTNNKKE